MRRILPVLVLLLAGCASPLTPSWSLVAPSTWFSHAPADKVDTAISKLDKKSDQSTKEAQKAVKEVKVALDSVKEPDRAVEVAKNANANAEVLLDQSEGPLSAKDLNDLKSKVLGLLSENKEVRARAEAQQAKDNQRVVELSDDLAKYKAALDKANANLRVKFDEENALANELRTHRAWAYIATGMAFLVACGWLYGHLMLGGIPSALGKGLARISQINGPAGQLLKDELDKLLNRNEQAAIAKHFNANS